MATRDFTGDFIVEYILKVNPIRKTRARFFLGKSELRVSKPSSASRIKMKNKKQNEADAPSQFGRIMENNSKIARQMEALKDKIAKEKKESLKYLSSQEKEYLEYFWNSKKREKHDFLPLDVIAFFELDAKDSSIYEDVKSRVLVDMNHLGDKGYVKKSGNDTQIKFELDNEGIKFINDAHPKLIVLWEGFFERTPKILSFLIGLIGVVASVLGIIQFAQAQHWIP
jgi:hypothetical protein